PHGIPALVWNMMMSVSGGWFFVVASEAITVSGQSIMLPGIGSYIATAIAQRNLGAIGYAVLVMLVVIILYDQLLFRPLLAWSQKFKEDPTGDDEYVRPWFLIVMRGIDGVLTLIGGQWGARGRQATRHAAAPAANWFERAFDVLLLLATM